MADPASRPEASRPDPLGLRRVLGDRLLPVMVAAMAFLAALALGGALAAKAWAESWRLGAGSSLTAQVPHPDDPAGPVGSPGGVQPSRLERSLMLLRASPEVAAARPLSGDELDELLEPWLGDRSAIQAMLPAVIAVRAAADAPAGAAAFDELAEALRTAVPGASLESHAAWIGRLATLLRALEAVAWGALALVAAIATLVIAAATRAGLVARRVTLDILHGLGATDAYVAAGFARRAMALAALGGVAGALLAIPVLIRLTRLARPLATAGSVTAWEAATGLPGPLWAGLALLPMTAAAIGYATAQGTVRTWLRRLP